MENQNSKSQSLGSVENQNYSHLWGMVVLFSILLGLVMYMETMLTVSLPYIAEQYKISISESSLVLAMYALMGTAISPLMGKLGDIYGKKQVMTAILFIYVVSVISTSFANTFEWLIISRTIQGIGIGLMPLIMSMVVESFPRDIIPRVTSIIRAIVLVGSGLGLPIGAIVSNSIGWQGNYRIIIPVIIVISALIIRFVKRTPIHPSAGRLDYIGGIWLAGSLAAIILALAEGAQWGWHSNQLLVVMGGGVVSTMILVLFERRIRDPILNLRLLSHRNVWVSTVLLLIMNLSVFLAYQTLTYEFQLPAPSGHGMGLIMTGVYLLPLAIVPLVLSYPIGYLIPRLGTKPFLYTGLILAALGFTLLSDTYNALQLSLFMIVVASGLSMISASAANILVLSVRKSRMGLANGLSLSFANIGRSIGPPIAAAIMSTYVGTYTFGGKTIILPLHLSFQLSYYAAILLLVFGFVAAIFSKEVIGHRMKNEIKEEFYAD